jgi:hypothetical protein
MRNSILALLCVAAWPARDSFAQSPQLPPYKSGFPLTLAGQGPVSSKPAIGDLRIPGDTVGVKSIVFGGNNGNLHASHRTHDLGGGGRIPRAGICARRGADHALQPRHRRPDR